MNFWFNPKKDKNGLKGYFVHIFSSSFLLYPIIQVNLFSQAFPKSIMFEEKKGKLKKIAISSESRIEIYHE